MTVIPSLYDNGTSKTSTSSSRGIAPLIDTSKPILQRNIQPKVEIPSQPQQTPIQGLISGAQSFIQNAIPNIENAIKQIAPVIVKGLKFAVTPTTIPQEAQNVQKAVTQVKQSVSKVKLPEITLPKPEVGKNSIPVVAIDVVKGLFGELNAQSQKMGGQNFAPNPNAVFKPTNKAQAFGQSLNGFLAGLVELQGSGINQSFEELTKTGIASIQASQTLAPIAGKALDKVDVITQTLQRLASNKVTRFLNDLKPLQITFQDLQDVTTKNATESQLARFEQFKKLQEAGLSAQDILGAAQDAGISPKTKVGDFLTNVINSVKTALKGSLKEEQRLLGSGIDRVITPGEYTSSEITAKVIGNNLENTPEGKQIIKLAAQAGSDTKITVSPEEVKSSIPAESPQTIVTKTEVSPTQTTIKPKEVSVPRSQLPVGEGSVKTSRLEARIKENLDNAPEEVKNLSTYSQMNKADQITKAVDYVTKNPEDALKVLQGQIEAPKGLLNNSIFVALNNQAADNAELARKLATLSATRSGQEISILSEVDPNSPVKLMKDIVKIREQAFQKRVGGQTIQQVTEKTVNDIKKAVKVPDKKQWADFLQSIECA